MANRSRLESLPIEMLNEICGYLVPSHDLLSNGVAQSRHVLQEFDEKQYNPSGPACIRPHLPGPALLRLSSTSRHLRSVVDSFSTSQLNSWVKAIASSRVANASCTDAYRYIFNKGDKLASHQAVMLDRKVNHTAILIQWMRHHCVFCGRFMWGARPRAIFAMAWAVATTVTTSTGKTHSSTRPRLSGSMGSPRRICSTTLLAQSIGPCCDLDGPALVGAVRWFFRKVMWRDSQMRCTATGSCIPAGGWQSKRTKARRSAMCFYWNEITTETVSG